MLQKKDGLRYINQYGFSNCAASEAVYPHVKIEDRACVLILCRAAVVNTFVGVTKEESMQFAFSKEQEMLRKAVREFAAKQIAPYADSWDADHYFPYHEAIKPMGELGFFGTVIPEKYGGESMGWLAAMIEIGRAHV